jgi:fumarate reductase subunit D
MKAGLALFKRRYGAGPWHLLLHLAAFAIAAFAMVQLLDERRWVNFLGWFVGAALLHDLVLLPVYSAIDRVAHSRLSRLHRPGRGARSVPIINHLRAPALISGLLLLIYFPLILGQAEPHYLLATGHRPEGYLRNWLLITLALFAGSGVVYLIRVWRR